MDRLPNEVLQLILNEQAKPASFVKLNRKTRAFASDSYVRARYFLARHGKAQALFYALGRGDIVTERVIEVLLSCGAHVSRHLIQLAVQHYHHGQVSFISRPWVRNLPFIVFARFLSLACARFNSDFKLPSKKDPDDGTKFQFWIAERKRKVGTDTEKEAKAVVEELIERWKFQPVCDKDPALAHFALTLAAEPKLLALAVANGYSVDPVYRDYIFRRLLVRPSEDTHRTDVERHDALLSILRDVCKCKGSSFFLSRTVAAEICLEVRANRVAYDVLKSLDRDGLLRFDLITLVQDLIKSFATTRSINPETIAAIHYLFNDLPARAANDTGVRHIVLLTVFSTSLTAHIANARLLKLGLRPDPVDAVPGVRQVYRVYHTEETLAPISRTELVPLLLSPYVHTHHAIATYARFYAFYPNKTVEDILEETALACLTLPNKGQMLETLTRRYSGLRNIIGRAIEAHKFDLDALPAHDASEDVKRRFRVALARVDDASVNVVKSMTDSCLGDLTHETLSESFARDTVEDASPWQWRRRSHLAQRGPHLKRKGLAVTAAKDKQTTGEASLSTARWVVDTYGSMSIQASIFADHIVANWLDERKPEYLPRGETKKGEGVLEDVPITMKHWEILRRLGRQPDARMAERIAAGETFYESANDYLQPDVLEPELEHGRESAVVLETEPAPAAEITVATARPRRAAADKIKSYIEVESESEGDGDGDSEPMVSELVELPIVRVKSERGILEVKAKAGKPASNLVKTGAVDPLSRKFTDVDIFDCECYPNCHLRCSCDCHSDMDSDDDTDDEGTPCEWCTLGLDCPERHAFFAAPADRRAAAERADQMWIEVETMRRRAGADKIERGRKEELEVKLKELKERIRAVDSRIASASDRRKNLVWMLGDSSRSGGVKILAEVYACQQAIWRESKQNCDNEIRTCLGEDQALRSEWEKLEPGGLTRREEQLALWVSALGAVNKEEIMKLADTKKRLDLKRVFKPPFVIVLEWCLLQWRGALHTVKEKRKWKEEAQVNDTDAECAAERKTKRRKVA